MLHEWTINLINLPIQYALLMASFYYLVNERPSWKRVLLSSLVIFLPSVFLYQMIFWSGILYLLVGMTIFFLWGNPKTKYLFYWGIVIIVAIISDHLATIIIFNLSFKGELFQFFLRTVLFICIHIFIIYLLFLLIKKIYFKLPKKEIWLINVVILCTICVFYFNIFRVFKYSKIELLRLNTILLTAYFILLIVLIGIIISIYLKKYELMVKEKELSNFSVYIQSLEQVNKDMQKFRHDYLNILLSLKGYIADKDWAGLETYFEQGILKFEQKTLESNKILAHLNNIRNLALKGLIFNKVSSAIEQNLKVSLEVPNPLKLEDDLIDLTRILGILLDNAIENCIEDRQEFIQLAVIEQRDSTLFVIRNKMDEKVIDINKLFREGYTTKEQGHGLGLSTVKKIVDSSSDMLLNISVENNWFNVELLILRQQNTSTSKGRR